MLYILAVVIPCIEPVVLSWSFILFNKIVKGFLIPENLSGLNNPDCATILIRVSPNDSVVLLVILVDVGRSFWINDLWI